MKLRRPSPALLISCLALFISLGGVSYGVATGFIDSREIKNNTIRTQDLRNNDIRGKDIRNSTIRTRDVAFNTLTGADINESRLTKVPAASDADTLGGLGSGAFLRSDATGFQALALGSGWSVVSGEQTPQYDVDPLGYVHLRGVVRQGAALDRAAVLPAGARPPATSYFFAARPDDPAGERVEIEADGDIVVPGAAAGDDVALDGITFKAGG